MKRIICFVVLMFTLLPLCFLTAGAKIYEGEAINKEWILEDVSGREMTDEEIEAIALAEYYRVQYRLDTETGELRIFCGKDDEGNKLEQKMLPYAHYMWLPWQSLGVMNTIKTAVIEEGVLSVGRYSFFKCDTIETVYIPHSVRKIDRTTFYQCKNLDKVYYAGTEEDFWKRVNLDEVRNWYAEDADGDGLENETEIKEYFKDKLIFGESVKVVCKNQDGDEITSYTIGGYHRGDSYTVTAPEIAGVTYTGEQTEFTGTFKKNDNTVWELTYFCDHEYAVTDPGLFFQAEPVKGGGKAIDRGTASRLIRALISIPHGVVEMSADIPGLIETSTNLASVKMENGHKILVGTMQRSSVNSERIFLSERVAAVLELAGAKVRHSDGYPGWKPNMNSHVKDVCVASYKRLFGREPIVRAIHAGLECGLFTEKFPDMDMIAFGPTLRGVHAPGERLDLASLERFWAVLLDVLKHL